MASGMGSGTGSGMGSGMSSGVGSSSRTPPRGGRSRGQPLETPRPPRAIGGPTPPPPPPPPPPDPPSLANARPLGLTRLIDSARQRAPCSRPMSWGFALLRSSSVSMIDFLDLLHEEEMDGRCGVHPKCVGHKRIGDILASEVFDVKVAQSKREGPKSSVRCHKKHWSCGRLQNILYDE
eukprot:SAG31_NODE_7117_length_1784_cov_3.031454_3_plen_179_part_00